MWVKLAHGSVQFQVSEPRYETSGSVAAYHDCFNTSALTNLFSVFLITLTVTQLWPPPFRVCFCCLPLHQPSAV
jgi:hypothetical protein